MPPSARVAAPLEGQHLLGGAPPVPQPDPQRDSHAPIRPDHPDYSDAIHRLAFPAGEAPRQALHRGREELRNDRVIEDQGAAFPDAQHATGALQECVPGPVGLQHSRQAVMGHGWQGLGQSHPRGRWAIREPGGAIEPNQRWHGVPSFVTVGWELYSISPPRRNL
jgi:hypothetical protein